MRWPDEEIGRNSVSPWVTPRTSACQSVSLLGFSPTPAAASPTVTAARAASTTAAARTPVRRLEMVTSDCTHVQHTSVSSRVYPAPPVSIGDRADVLISAWGVILGVLACINPA